MKGENFNKPGHKPRVLVAPLEWGLGHATRCIPIITSLLQHDCEVIIAAEGGCRRLLQEEFPSLSYCDIKGYRMRYSRKKFWLPAKLLIQFPKIILSIYTEHRWLKKIAKQYDIDAVISDNRFGMYHSALPCIYITHQLKIKTGNRFTEWLAQKIHYRFINKYKECWVPDTKEGDNLAGELSHPDILPHAPVIYLGPLSRFERSNAEIRYDLAIILSGPEPQRTLFEEIILKDLRSFKGKALLVRGLPGKSLALPGQSSPVEIHDHLPAAELNRVILQSDLVISRCGYTTVMDLVKLQKKAILVPTPGQTEQEYLARYLMTRKYFFCIDQQEFSLSHVLKDAADFSFNKTGFQHNAYVSVIQGFIKKYLGNGEDQ
ncbi:MAG TPA: glycosyltransferase [Ferruginibacter sp.]|nr:glycosyltransferase [Ferruginibacter sp.]